MFELNGLMVTVHAQEILEALERAADHFSDGFARFLLFANTSRATNIQSNFVESWLQFGIKSPFFKNAINVNSFIEIILQI